MIYQPDDQPQPAASIAGTLLQLDPSSLQRFLDATLAVSIVLLDRDYRISMCNQGFLHMMRLSACPAGRAFTEFLLPESVSLLPAHHPGRTTPLALNFLPASLHVHKVRSQLVAHQDGFILFGDKFIPTDETFMRELSRLNSEFADITRELHKQNLALEQANTTITQLMLTDALTGIANRRHVLDTLGTLLSQAARHGFPVSVVMTDIDHFKQINDTYGHAKGDEVLRIFATLLSTSCRKGDMPARIGGEEFLVVLPHAPDEAAAQYAERVRRQTACHPFAGMTSAVTSSFGVSMWSSSDTLEALLQRADQALYHAKMSGRNRVAIARGSDITLFAPGGERCQPPVAP